MTGNNLQSETLIKGLNRAYLWLLALPYALIFLGALSNQVVLITNHGKFPVLLEDSKARKYDADNGMIDGTHCTMSGNTKLNLLADVFNFHTEIESIGDLSIDLGLFIQPYTFGGWLFFVFVRLTP